MAPVYPPWLKILLFSLPCLLRPCKVHRQFSSPFSCRCLSSLTMSTMQTWMPGMNSFSEPKNTRQDQLHSLQGLMQNENKGHLVQKLLWFSRQWLQNIKPSTEPFWVQVPIQMHRAHTHKVTRLRLQLPHHCLGSLDLHRHQGDWVAAPAASAGGLRLRTNTPSRQAG